MIYLFCILTIFGALCSLWISKYDTADKDLKIKALSASQIIIALVLASLSIYKDNESGKQHDRIEKLDSLNNKLALRLDTLSTLNNSIAINSRQIELDNKTIEERNSKLNDSIRYIVSFINSFNLKRYDEDLTRGTFDLKFNKAIKGYKDFKVMLGTNVLGLIDSIHFENHNNFDLPLSFKIANNKLLISGEIIDYNKNHLIEIIDNNWFVNAHFKDKLNYDNKGFEVIDDKNNVIFSLDILDGGIIKVQGIMIWKQQHGITIIVDKEMSEGGNFDNKYHDSFNDKFRRLFVYTGRNWLHKRTINK